MKNLLLLVVLGFLIFSCSKEEKDVLYSVHDIVLPDGINKEEHILAFQLESDEFTNSNIDDDFISCFPHPILTQSWLTFELKSTYENFVIQVSNQSKPDKKTVYDGKMNIGGNQIALEMNVLFNNSYGFYTIYAMNGTEIIEEKEIFYTNGLHYSSDEGNLKIVEILIKMNVDVNIKTFNKKTS